MRRTAAILSALILTCLPASGYTGDAHRAAGILERFKNANQWRQHVMVVAHRAGWKENGVTVRPENSIAAIRHSIALGVEMIEMDVRKSADGKLVVMHDSWLDRTTTCKGEVEKRTLEELRKCHLVVEGSREPTEEVVPTLDDMLAAARNEILVNIDNKLGPDILPEVADHARALGMGDQIVVKQNLWNAAKVDEAKATMRAVGADITFMPIFADDAVSDASFMARAAGAFRAPAAEMINWHADGAPMTERGGPLFSPKARAAAIAGNWHLWANTYTIVNRPAGLVSGGRGDELAVFDNRPDDVFGFWIDRGVTIIQTDEPKAAIAWLEDHGYRIPYDLTN